MMIGRMTRTCGADDVAPPRLPLRKLRFQMIADTESEFSILFLEEKGYRKDLFISFPIYAKSTIEEAIAVCPELKRLGASKILIVTSAYHSLRANVVFRLFCPGLTLRSIAAPDTQFEAENWWKNEHCRRIFFSEWTKLLGTIFWKYPAYELNRLGTTD
jgi:hypothetical protein